MLDLFLSMGADVLVQTRREEQLNHVLGEKRASVDITKLGGTGTEFIGNFTNVEDQDKALALEEREMMLENTIQALEDSGRDSTEARRDLEELRFQKQMLHAQSFASQNEEPPPLKTNDIDGTTTPSQDSAVGSQISSKIGSDLVDSILTSMVKEALPGFGGIVNAGKAVMNTKGLASAVGEKALKSVAVPTMIGAGIGAATSDDAASGAMKGALIGGIGGGLAKGYSGISKIQQAAPKMNFEQAANKFVTSGIRDVAKEQGIKGFNKNLNQINAQAKATTSVPGTAAKTPPAAAPNAAAPPPAQAPASNPAPSVGSKKSINVPAGKPNPAPAPQPPVGPTPSGSMPVAQGGTGYSNVQAPQAGAPNSKPSAGATAPPPAQNSAVMNGVKQQAPNPAPPAAPANTPANSPAAPANAAQQASAPATPTSTPDINSLSTSQRVAFNSGNPVYDASGKVMIPANPSKFQAYANEAMNDLSKKPFSGGAAPNVNTMSVPSSPSASNAVTGKVRVANIPSAAMPSVKAASRKEALHPSIVNSFFLPFLYFVLSLVRGNGTTCKQNCSSFSGLGQTRNKLVHREHTSRCFGLHVSSTS